LLLERPLVGVAEFEQRSGWHVRPQGLCRDDVCLPLAANAVVDGYVDIRLIGLPLVHDAALGLWALGPPASGPALASAVAPELVLPDLNGQPFDLAALHGSKVLLLAWASW
jgi:hypothetical protein